MVTLLTGFEPFGGSLTNPSWDAVRELATRREIATALLPCAFDSSLATLQAAIAEHEPEVVICVGQAGGRAGVTPERIAVNIRDARIPDNAGDQPIDVPVVESGPAAYFTTLPIKAGVQRILRAGIAAEVSHTAGTYVCNNVFYGLMHLIATELPNVRGGFVHVPFSPEQGYDDKPSMPVATIATALGLLVDTCHDTKQDLVISTGTLH
ncbi:pyrrolidone-carboxylate peptidase [Lentzea sp. NBRC 105346]|uniref:pyroglutamyl-peptidase I n=1 Tax=Lentzea sp. NBRC 105346 TaxID=3032205 RepID=UPI0024A31A3C|nr:pyroglutamyl-peptidase I [Lentzea sp. NBRC 105346]GLZ32903.1 pyrrolidone-carboxylate peptidase [Lentzea sp. NBRC 105346]